MCLVFFEKYFRFQSRVQMCLLKKIKAYISKLYIRIFLGRQQFTESKFSFVSSVGYS